MNNTLYQIEKPGSGSQENLYISDEEGSDDERVPAVQGVLSKWTNLLHGWQERFFVVKEGVLSYYKSADETSLGCRGAIRLRNAYLRPHEYDECRFEVRVGDSIWYLRAANIEERYRWIQAIERHRVAESGYGSEPNLRRQNSLVSINSATSLSIASASSFKRGHGLKEKLAEMETFKEILCKQVDSLQGYFDACSAIVRHAAHDQLEHYLDEQDSDHLLDDHDASTASEDRDGGSSTSSSDVLQLQLKSSSRAPLETCGEGDAEVEHNNNSSSSHEQEVADVTLTPATSVVPVVEQAGTQASGVQSRGFLSRFFPFRSGQTAVSAAVPVPTVQTSQTLDMLEHGQQYRPSSRYHDLKRILEQHGAHALDFKGEAYTFKATTTGILTNLGHCIELMQQREEQWRKRLDREMEKRRRAEDAFRALSHEHNRMPPKMIVLGGPDFEEGPNCAIGEEEFFDAIDAQLDKMALADERLEALRAKGSDIESCGAMQPDHLLYEEVERVVADHLNLCDPCAIELRAEDGWQVIAEDGEMIIYKREMESSDGIVLDPLQAMHTVEGVTARELCTYFWDVKYRMDWEITVDEPPTVLEVCGDDTVVLHQAYKRIWPASQRDSVFWSHIRKVSECSLPSGAKDMWMVMNYSTDYESPVVVDDTNGMIRLTLDVALICQTVVSGEDNGEELTRSRIKSKLLYASSINPGGWAPASVLRTLAKREYPRFIKRFSQYVIDQTSDKPIFM